jgi:hypothetical protein
VIDICLATQPQNGGLLSMEELLVRMKAVHSRTSRTFRESS